MVALVKHLCYQVWLSVIFPFGVGVIMYIILIDIAGTPADRANENFDKSMYIDYFHFLGIISLLFIVFLMLKESNNNLKQIYETVREMNDKYTENNLAFAESFTSLANMPISVVIMGIGFSLSSKYGHLLI